MTEVAFPFRHFASFVDVVNMRGIAWFCTGRGTHGRVAVPPDGRAVDAYKSAVITAGSWIEGLNMARARGRGARGGAAVVQAALAADGVSLDITGREADLEGADFKTFVWLTFLAFIAAHGSAARSPVRHVVMTCPECGRTLRLGERQLHRVVRPGPAEVDISRVT